MHHSPTAMGSHACHRRTFPAQNQILWSEKHRSDTARMAMRSTMVVTPQAFQLQRVLCHHDCFSVLLAKPPCTRHCVQAGLWCWGGGEGGKQQCPKAADPAARCITANHLVPPPHRPQCAPIAPTLVRRGGGGHVSENPIKGVKRPRHTQVQCACLPPPGCAARNGKQGLERQTFPPSFRVRSDCARRRGAVSRTLRQGCLSPCPTVRCCGRQTD